MEMPWIFESADGGEKNAKALEPKNSPQRRREMQKHKPQMRGRGMFGRRMGANGFFLFH
jgi:hypothetical protein